MSLTTVEGADFGLTPQSHACGPNSEVDAARETDGDKDGDENASSFHSVSVFTRLRLGGIDTIEKRHGRGLLSKT